MIPLARHFIYWAAIMAMMPSPAVAADTVLNMAVVSRTVFYLPAWMAEKQGFFKAEGLTKNRVRLHQLRFEFIAFLLDLKLSRHFSS